MRKLLAIVVLAALGLSGWWYWHAQAREAAVAGWLAERRAAGWVAEAADISVRGFPNRIDLTVRELALADPAAGWSWSAPAFQVLSLTWKPHHVISVWPGPQTIASPYETARIESRMMRGSVVFVPGLALELDRTAIEIDGMVIEGGLGWRASIERAVLATRRSPNREGEGHPHDVSLKAEGLVLPAAWTVGLERTGVLPEAIEAADLDATLVFDRPWERRTVEGENPTLEAVEVRDLRVQWGRLDLRGRGTLVADAEGLAEGTLTMRVRNWQEMLAVAVGAELIAPGTARAVETGLGLIARLAGTPDAIEVPLVFADGRAHLSGPFGTIAVGDAPRLTGRR